ncbi:hypothetical protein GLOTRDRAFT_102066 [Gloeophyllum trabeum ATCC 11539]|uniref:N-acetyltransferase domain-containing protein n=1 Tax=Gloeophyllum trabeum (strain ATCC 11539 / FP-39264 / Madison 617) TaxID=670483 RepID=S7RZ36_GLOTA|nr:uncharacterized protein GLOTRDRAFT_102066 [Gloeophyllum trabeum ATCC 11539]EPQ60255.1 hypothetical protein GLOTRDRAFT_102066 [Gloeophyllum trabeum ATCC 11539]
MPGLIANFLYHDSADDFLSVAYPTLRRIERSSNIILAHALKRVSAEAVLTDYEFISQSDIEKIWTEQVAAHLPASALRASSSSLWLTLWSSPSPSGPHSLDLVLSCLNWRLGDYPIFLWSPHQFTSSASLVPRVARLAEHLVACVPPERVFSVFGMTPLVKTFARYWTELTGFRPEPEPFYAAFLTYCTAETLRSSDNALPSGHRLRDASMTDLESVAQLCKEFADDSVYFPLTIDAARVEAEELIRKRQIWVYDADGEITTICAVTRNSVNVSAITKVYTLVPWRKKGCAQHLVRYVTSKLLFEYHKESVVLYVGHTNNAQYVYAKVGFVGLCGNDRLAGVEDSLELGFVGTHRGHW